MANAIELRAGAWLGRRWCPWTTARLRKHGTERAAAQPVFDRDGADRCPYSVAQSHHRPPTQRHPEPPPRLFLRSPLSGPRPATVPFPDFAGRSWLMQFTGARLRYTRIALLAALMWAGGPSFAVLAQDRVAPEGVSPDSIAPNAVAMPRGATVPGFWDPRRRPERPDLSRIQSIRFLTETRLSAVRLCRAGWQSGRLQRRSGAADLRRDQGQPAPSRRAASIRCSTRSNDNRGDAVIASIASTAETRKRADFTDPYYRTPARFVARPTVRSATCCRKLVEGKKIAVVAGTAHEAFLKTDVHRGRACTPIRMPKRRARRCATRRSICCSATASRWRSGSTAPIPPAAARSAAGPILESRFFGEGVGIAVKRGNDLLRQALNWALFRLWEKGSFTDLWLRYFPISPF